MKVKVIDKFYDRENDLKLREKGEEFTVKKERGLDLIGRGFVKEVKGGDPEVSQEA